MFYFCGAATVTGILKSERNMFEGKRHINCIFVQRFWCEPILILVLFQLTVYQHYVAHTTLDPVFLGASQCFHRPGPGPLVNQDNAPNTGQISKHLARIERECPERTRGRKKHLCSMIPHSFQYSGR